MSVWIKVIKLISDQIIEFFLNNVEDVKIINQELRLKTFIMLGRKTAGDNFENIINEENNKTDIILNKEESKNVNDLIDVSKKKKSKYYDELEPNLKIMEYIFSHEKRSLNRNSILRPMIPTSGFENLIHTCRRVFTKERKNDKVKNESMSFFDELVSGESDLRENKAIIIVPTSFYPGNINIENAKQFFVDAIYVNLDQEKVTINKNSNLFAKKILNKELNFEIHCNVRNFSKNDWKRVVAVFVQGNEWEFNDWPRGETITSIFLKVRGFHLKYSDLPLNENIKKWNIKVLEINRTKRHSVVSVQNLFWTTLEEFLVKPRYR